MLGKKWMVFVLCSVLAACRPTSVEAPPENTEPAPPVPRTWNLLSPTTSPSPRVLAALSFDSAAARILLVGGQPYAPLPLGDIWQWDGRVWSELIPTGTTLPTRKNHGVAYDAIRQKTVVFGGIRGGLAATPIFLSDTWEWDGTAWADRTPTTTSPAPRSGHALAYDAARQRVLMFGGLNNSGPEFGDTWEWDGAVWTQKTVSKSPPPRFNTRMVYDAARARVVLFGGQDLQMTNFNDVWEWDGSTWTDATPTAGVQPPGRGFHSMAYDAQKKRVVVYGGTTRWPPYINATNIFADHWEWDGSTWTLVGDKVGPGQRSGAGLEFDPVRNRLLLFGGMKDSAGELGDTWEFGTFP